MSAEFNKRKGIVACIVVALTMFIFYSYLIGLELGKCTTYIAGKSAAYLDNISCKHLRNFFAHHLGSKEAEIFLNNHSMLFFLKSTITIIILKFLGLQTIMYDKRFHKVSIFNDNIGECDYFSRFSIS